MAKVEIRGVSKRWESVVAVDNLDLTVNDQEFAAILGPSGCGKSTTLFMLAGIYLPTEGDILFDGARVNDVEARYRNIGIVFQSYALYPNMTALQNILFPLRFQKVSDGEARAREMADLVQVSELLDRRPGQLSGGQQQRVALARALVKRPNLLLLDEPLSNLDATLRLSMREEIRRITSELAVTTILVTHDQVEATTMADRIICMNKGRIEQSGTAEDLYLRPQSHFVARFIGSPPINLIDVTVGDGVVEFGSTLLKLNVVDGEVTIGLRPEMLKPSLSREGTGSVSSVELASTDLPGIEQPCIEQPCIELPSIEATVTYVEPMGRETLTTVSTDVGSLRFLESTTRPNWNIDDQLYLSFKPSDAMIFDNNNQLFTGAELSPVHQKDSVVVAGAGSDSECG